METTDLTDRALIAEALNVASALTPGEEPTDSARRVIVELCKRVRFPTLSEPFDPSERFTAMDVWLALSIGLAIGGAITAGVWWVVGALTA